MLPHRSPQLALLRLLTSWDVAILTKKTLAAYYLRQLIQVNDCRSDTTNLMNSNHNTSLHLIQKFGVSLGWKTVPLATKSTTRSSGRPVTASRTRTQNNNTFCGREGGKDLCRRWAGRVVCDDSGIGNTWILHHVTPNMLCDGISHQMCLVLGRALLWKMQEAANGERQRWPWCAVEHYCLGDGCQSRSWIPKSSLTWDHPCPSCESRRHGNRRQAPHL